MIFVIPLRSQKTSINWENVCTRLKSTLDSILNQQTIDKKIEIVIAGHEKPYFLDGIKYQNINFLNVLFDIPVDKSQFMADKLNKKKFAGIFVRNNLLTENKSELVMQIDADDLLHPEFVSNIKLAFDQNPLANDIALMNGYAFDFKRQKLAYLNGIDKIFYRNCGSSFISKVNKDDMPTDIDSSCYFNYLANHVKFPEIAKSNGRSVYELFYPGVMYLVNHGSNDVAERENGENIIKNFIDSFAVQIKEHPTAISMINQI